MGFVVVKAFDYLVSPAPPSNLGNMGYATKAYWVDDFAGGTTASSSYAYDAAGCLTNLNSTVLEWDERYRLTNVLATEGTKITYGYDVLRRRISRKTTNSQLQTSNSVHYVYDGNQIVADLDGEGNLLRSYVWGQGIDNLLSLTVHERDGGVASTFYPIKDHQNTILALDDGSGTVVEGYEYTAYGETRVFNADGVELAESALGNRYTFQGREIDWDTGFYYFRARWYDPEAGRWISKDPIGIAGGLNLYEFCGSNPVNFVDPSGLAPGDSYECADGAARDALKDIYDITAKTGWEHGGWIVRNPDGTYTYTTYRTQENPKSYHPGITPSSAVGIYHSHVGGLPGTNPENFSGRHGEPFYPGDRSQGTARNVDVYLVTPSGDMKVYRHRTGAESSIGHL